MDRTVRDVALCLWWAGTLTVGIVVGPWWGLAWWAGYPLAVMLAAFVIVGIHELVLAAAHRIVRRSRPGW